MAQIRIAILQGQRGVYNEMREVSPSEPLEEAWAILLRSAIQEDNSEAVNWVAGPQGGLKAMIPCVSLSFESLFGWTEMNRIPSQETLKPHYWW